MSPLASLLCWRKSHALFRLFACGLGILCLESVPVSVKARPNPITSYTRLWAEWDVVPNTQWAPRSIDPSATQDRSLQIFKLQPVVPFRINDDWTVLTRTIFRFLSLPQADPVLGFSPAGLPAVVDFDQKNQAGLSDVSPTAFLVPNLGSDWTVGLGSSIVFPTGDGTIDSGKVSAGPAFLAFYHSGPWIVGARMRNIWSFAGDPERDDVNTLVVRGLLRYQLNRSWYLISSPIIASDWTQPEGKGWIVPVGGGLGYSFRVGGSRCRCLWRVTTTLSNRSLLVRSCWVTGRFERNGRFFSLIESGYWWLPGLSMDRNLRISLMLRRPGFGSG